MVGDATFPDQALPEEVPAVIAQNVSTISASTGQIWPLTTTLVAPDFAIEVPGVGVVETATRSPK